MANTPVRWAAAQSSEYKAALAAQLDYDATHEGLARLEAALTSSTRPDEARRLTSRKIAAEHARAFRLDQVALMPPLIHRGAPGHVEYNRLAHARERLARNLAWAASEAFMWTKPSAQTMVSLFEQLDAVAAADGAVREPVQVWRHPQLLAADRDATVPWTNSRDRRGVTAGDVAILRALGMEVTWRNGALQTTGDPASAFRWGYAGLVVGASASITSAPDLHAWFRRAGAAKAAARPHL